MSEKIGDIYVEISADVEKLKKDLANLKQTAGREASQIEKEFSKTKLTFDDKLAKMKLSQLDKVHAALKAKLERQIKANVSVGDLSKTKADLGSVEAAINKFKNTGSQASKEVISNFANIGMAITGINQGLELISKGIALFAEPLKAFGEGELAAAQLSTALQMSGNSSKTALEELQAYAKELQQLTVFEDDAYIAIMAQYQAMGLNADETKNASLMSANLASLMGGDLAGSVKVMADLFAGDATMIKRYIKGLDETILKSGDMGAIMDMLNQKIGGQATTAANTSSGALKQLSNAYGDMQEDMGELIAGGILPFVNASKGFLESTGKTGAALFMFGQAALGAIPLVGSLGMAVQGLGPMFSKLKLAMLFDMTTFKASMLAAQASMVTTGTGTQIVAGGFRTAGLAVKGFLTSIGPIGWVTLGVTALVTAMSFLGDETEEVNKGLSEAEKNAASEAAMFKNLTTVIGDTNRQMTDRKTALSQLQSKYPEYLKNLDLEKISSQDLAKALSIANDQYERKARLAVLSQQYDKGIADQMRIEKEIKNISSAPSFQRVTQTGHLVNDSGRNTIIKGIVNERQKELDKLKAANDEILKQMSETSGTPTTTPTGTGGGGKTNITKTKEELQALYEVVKTITADTKAAALLSSAGITVPGTQIQGVEETERPVPIQETTQQIVEDYANKSAIVTSLTTNAANSMAEAFGMLQIRFSENASTMERIFGGFANAVISDIQRIVAQWAVLNILGFALGGSSGGVSLLGMLGIGGHSGGNFLGTNNGVMKLAGGGNFTVPQGFNNDSFPMMVETGERVKVTPAGRAGEESKLLASINNSIAAMNMNLVNKDMRVVVNNNAPDVKTTVRKLKGTENTLTRQGIKFSDY